MERRNESRLKISKNARLRVLSPMAGPSQGQPVDVRVIEISGSGMRIEMSVPVPCGAAIEITGEHVLVLGEISRCVPDGRGYTVGVRVEETLFSLEEAARFRRELEALSQAAAPRSEDARRPENALSSREA
jgi:hypothetical protein